MFKIGFDGFCKKTDERLGWILSCLNLEWNQELEDAIEFTHLEATPKEVVSCAWTVALLLTAAGLLLSAALFCLGINPIVHLLLSLILATSLAYYISNYPKILAKKIKIKSMGCAPEIVAYLIIPLKHNPNLEDAVRFAAEHGEGQMAEDLTKALRDVWMGNYRSIGEALPVLGYRWGKDIKGFEDAMYAIRTSQIEKSEARRLNTLDRALNCVLESIQKKFEEYISFLRLPTMVLFAGGALFPLVVIILLPMVSFVGIGIGTPVNIFIILMLIVLSIFLFSEYTLSRRPAAFTPVKIPDDHPGLPPRGKMVFLKKTGSAWKISFCVGLAISLLSAPYFFKMANPLTDSLSTLPVVAGAATGLWVYLRGTSQPKKELWGKLRKMEGAMIEAAFQLGNRLIGGVSAEEALVRVAGMIAPHPEDRKKSSIAEVFDKAIQNIRYLNMGLEDSFFDTQKGALKNVYSGVVNSVFKVFTIAMKKSIHAASEALIVAAGHIREIKKVESSLKERMSYTTSMIKTTALFINPIICGLSVHILELFRKTMSNTGSLLKAYSPEKAAGFMLTEPMMTPEMLQLITGIYMISLLVVLIRYVSVLENGDDPVMHKLAIANSIPVALFTFMAIIAMSGLL